MSNIGKRFAKPAIWEQPHFTNLNLKQRLFWLFLNNRCDLAGVYQLHFPVDSAYLGFDIDQSFVDNFIKAINTDAKRLKEISKHRLWLVDFVRYQQIGKNRNSLSAKAGPHISIVNKLKEHELLEAATERDPELFQEFTGEVIDPDYPKGRVPIDYEGEVQEGASTDSNYPNASLAEGYRKGYSSSHSNRASNGKSYSPPTDLVNKAQTILDAYPKKNKDGSDISILATIEDVLKDLKADGVKDPESYLLTEIEKLNRKDAPLPDVFFSELKQRKEIPF